MNFDLTYNRRYIYTGIEQIIYKITFLISCLSRRGEVMGMSCRQIRKPILPIYRKRFGACRQYLYAEVGLTCFECRMPPVPTEEMI